jgi:ribosome-associated toxin RatA of RatAB toxin-antitoxin module
MHMENRIVIRAPLERIFTTVADLSNWPRILPHYRWIRFREQSPTRNAVVMAARRKWIPVRWTSEQTVDPERHEIHFRHLTAFTRGMHVVWTFTPTPDGVEVCIRHELQPNIPLIGRFISETIIGNFFISYIANQTLTHFKRYFERQDGT